MAEELIIKGETREERYHSLIPQIKALCEGEKDLIANLANISAALKNGLNFLWCGFYLVKGDELVLGPFQGPVACTRIRLGSGVCGNSWKEKKAIIVPDVDQYPGHITCSSLSKSEIAVPVMKNGQVLAVIDIDSEVLNDFSAVDQKYLEELAKLIADFYVQ
jgi:L-methionine (R)-S-oxide reductase